MALNLSKRERYSLYTAIAVIFLFVFSSFIVSPYLDKKKMLRRTIKIKTKDIEQMLAMKSEYQVIQKKADISRLDFASRGSGFRLFSFLDKLAGEAGVKDRITYMKPSTSGNKDGQYKISSVEMKLEGINMEQLVSCLYKIETSKKMVYIKRLSIYRKGELKRTVDAVLQVETVMIL
ncbi:MAG: hypothetical protein HN737_07295 [Desulfobacterales bacterium]|jgi:general secretion pathway protein M|nr:hypothetical protein [Desulfobacteraceae bacterium]MBT4364931.1 hypothetical protein [Desulfobacteraceae bacterium]MBT7084560.1 hypothetical protein [Desulfobacterales bacterium]MBT7697200.1 hypothetical protein [Desulfobacterales bacterium]